MWLSLNDKYECSVNGIVRNKKTLKELKPSLKNGYYVVSINHNNLNEAKNIRDSILNALSSCKR